MPRSRKLKIKLAAADLKQILKAVSWRVETAPPVIARVHKPGKAKADPLRGLFEATVAARQSVVEYEPDPDLRDTEQVPLLEARRHRGFIRREVLPYTPDAWIKEDATKIGYEISFTRHFYKPQPLRTLEEISADILAIEKETEGLSGDREGSREMTESRSLIAIRGACEGLKRDGFISSTPTALRPAAQGCEQRATLGKGVDDLFQPQRGCASICGGRKAATPLGLT